MQHRKIPKSGEDLPVIGLGTWRTFDVASERGRIPLGKVLDHFSTAGGRVIDTSPMYGKAEEAIGELQSHVKKPFIATKVWTRGREAGIEQMKRSMRFLRVTQIDLLQIHNLVDWQTHLPTLRAWKKEGRIRYLGITHYTESAHTALETTLKAGGFDFVQVDYSLDDRAAERHLLPYAADNGVAVLINMPFGGGGLLRKLLPRPLPAWAGEIGCTSWAQILLKFVLANKAVTCAIPGTGKPEHMRDNVQAGLGAYPDAALLKRMVADIGV